MEIKSEATITIHGCKILIIASYKIIFQIKKMIENHDLADILNPHITSYYDKATLEFTIPR